MSFPWPADTAIAIATVNSRPHHAELVSGVRSASLAGASENAYAYFTPNSTPFAARGFPRASFSQHSAFFGTYENALQELSPMQAVKH